MKLSKEDRYIRRRLRQGRKQAREFYYCRKYPINPKKIVFTTIEGTTGFSCNPKYIALELLKRRQDLELVWLVDDMTKEFPAGIRKVKNTLKNRAYELSTAAAWVNNSRKPRMPETSGAVLFADLACKYCNEANRPSAWGFVLEDCSDGNGT